MPGVHFVPTAIPGESDGLDVETGPGTFVKQGHQDQFIAEMVEWNVARQTYRIDGKDYTFDKFLSMARSTSSTTSCAIARRTSVPRP